MFKFHQTTEKSIWARTIANLESKEFCPSKPNPVIQINNLINNHFVDGKYALMVPMDTLTMGLIQDLYIHYYRLNHLGQLRSLILAVLCWQMAMRWLLVYSFFISHAPDSPDFSLTQHQLIEALNKCREHLKFDKPVPELNTDLETFSANLNWYATELSDVIDTKLKLVDELLAKI